ncbi:MAG: hypothetical protein AAGC96_10070 [Pseudomonadota bacterium]
MKGIVFVRVVKAWLIGLASAGLIFVPMAFTLTTSVPYESLSDVLAEFISEIPSGIAIVLILGVAVSLPLLLIAFLFAFFCRNLITDNRLFFTFLAPIVTATIVALYFDLAADETWRNSAGFLNRFGQIFFSWSVWIFVFPVLVSAAYYCFYLKHPARSR